MAEGFRNPSKRVTPFIETILLVPESDTSAVNPGIFMLSSSFQFFKETGGSSRHYMCSVGLTGPQGLTFYRSQVVVGPRGMATLPAPRGW